MAIFNVRVCVANNTIQMKSVTLYLNHQDNSQQRMRSIQLSISRDGAPDGELLSTHTILQQMKDKFYYSNSAGVEQAVNQQFDPKFSYCVAEGAHFFPMHANPTSYTLPSNPTLALDLLAAYVGYAKEAAFTHIQFVDYDLADKIGCTDAHPNRNVMINRMRKLGKPASDVETMLQMLIVSILNLEQIPAEYNTTIAAIKKIYRYSLAHPELPLSQCLEGELRISILLDVPAEALSFTTIPSLEDRMRELYSIARKFIADDHHIELSRFIYEMNLETKKILYHRCIGQQRFHGISKYSWNDFLWKTFSSAAFVIRRDGRMSFDLQYIPDFPDVFKEGQDNADFLFNEFCTLAAALGLKIDVDSKFPGEVIFSKESSQHLINAGLHYNLDYVKKLLRERWTASLFNQARKYSANEKQTSCSLHGLPRDIENIIFGLAYSEKQQGLLPVEKNAMRALGLQDNPLTGLNTLFLKPAVKEEAVIERALKNKCVIC